MRTLVEAHGAGGKLKLIAQGPTHWLLSPMNFMDEPWWLVGWVGAMSAASCLLFGYDKWQAGRQGGRLAESTLLLASAVGGWPGGLAGMVLFRHKTAKRGFQAKFTMTGLVWAGLVWLAWQAGPRVRGF
ncbi:MAG TPA: DUF1294 domain-containing protein [Lacunisphaera sp.]|nr:DUF1294 domain-containing protein [Lacunisphaera sp.]